MEHKHKSFSRIKRHQSDKVLRYSIRKYSFGAASVAVAALMFLGAHTVSADAVDAKNQPALGAPNPNEEKSPLIEPAPTAKNEETKETEKVEVAKETEKPAENNEAVENESLNNRSNNGASSEKETPASDKVVEKQTLDKSQLQASITKVQELLDKVNKEKAPASTLAAIQADLEAANSVLHNNSLGLTQAEVDAAAKKLSGNQFVLSSMPKANAPEKVVKEGKNTIANTGSHDSRNGLNMGEGSSLRAASISSTWDSSDNLLIYQRHRASDGSRVVRNGLREYTENKVDMFAKTTTIGGERYVTYDVFFNNDGNAMANLSRYQIYRLILPPQILDLNNDGTYKGNTLRDLKFETYQKNGGSGTLSQNPERFTKTGSYNVNFLNDSSDYGPAWKKLTYFYGLDIRHGNSYDGDMRDTFKGNSNDPLLNYAVTRTESKFNKYSYGFGVKTEDKTAAVHMQVNAKLKAGVTDNQVRDAFALAVAGTYGPTTNQAYTFIS